MTLAVVTQNPNAVAETYVRHHMREIAPGRTVAVALNGTAPPFEIPFLNLTRSPANPLRAKAQTLLSLLRSGYAGALLPAQEGQLDTFFAKHGVTTVYAEFGPTGCALRHYCRRRDLPLFVHFHGYDATVMPRSILIRHAYRQLARDAAGFMCGSRHFRRILEALGFPGERIWVIPCGVDVVAFRDSGQHDPDLVIAVGRLTVKKAPHLMLEAFALAAREHPQLRLEVIGDGPLRPQCEAVVAREGLQARVVFHGACGPDFVRARLSEAGVFVQHSVTAPNGDQESQGISLIEAMASGLPVVVTDHNGFCETVEQGESGFLVAERDVVSMAEHIGRLATDVQLRETMGKRARQVAVDLFSATGLTERLRKALGMFPHGTPLK